MRTFWHTRPAKTLLLPILLAAALLSAGVAHVAAAEHASGSVAACPLGTNWDAAAHSCK